MKNLDEVKVFFTQNKDSKDKELPEKQRDLLKTFIVEAPLRDASIVILSLPRPWIKQLCIFKELTGRASEAMSVYSRQEVEELKKEIIS